MVKHLAQKKTPSLHLKLLKTPKRIMLIKRAQMLAPLSLRNLLMIIKRLQNHHHHIIQLSLKNFHINMSLQIVLSIIVLMRTSLMLKRLILNFQ
ncbi:unnamed protein product [Trichobilharzia regenti]|nr:unnamed protein product [Trichobilharzia regenti]